MLGVLSYYRTSIGKKTVMAVTGLIGVLFVVGHLVGNLGVYRGQESFNAYAEFLREVGEGYVLWIVRAVLLGAVLAHIIAAVQLTLENRKARGQRYAYHRYVQASFATRTLRWGGLILFLFIIYHILHLTLGVAPGQTAFTTGDPYNNLVNGFQNPFVAGFYILAMAALGMHVVHGLWSLFQSLGLNNNRWNRLWRNLAILLAIILFVGNISIPIAVLAGLVQNV